MVSHPKLLVVDDEALYCQACRRIFTGQGFQVDESNDAGAGLKLATENDYAAILLDVKMPTMDGMEFLQHLRAAKPDVPVIMMTGFPSIPNAASAVRLKASDYVTKPFTPEEITQAVHKLLGENAADSASANAPEAWTPKSPEFRFLGRSWSQEGGDGSIRCGAVLPRTMLKEGMTLVAPRIGEVVFHGLPMFAIEAGGRLEAVASPVCGVVTAVNSRVQDNPALLWDSPCRESWVATVAPTRPEECKKLCKPRRVLLAGDAGAMQKNAARLRELGCELRTVAGAEELCRLAAESESQVVVLDEVSLGNEGPAIAQRIKDVAPAIKILVLGSAKDARETAFREKKIFYYAVRPFEDNEIVQILDAMFCPEVQNAARSEEPRGFSEPIRGIYITNHGGRKICLLTPDGIIKTGKGMGKALCKRLLDGLFPIETYLGDKPLVAGDVLKASSSADRVFVLTLKDMGRIPGCLTRDAKGQYDWADEGKSSDKLTSLVIQPDACGKLDGLSAAVLDTLAEHIAAEMAGG